MKQKTFYDGDFNVKKLDLDKIIKFVLTSGIGFVLDFISYFMMTQLINISVVYANFTSSIIGATFVFIVSTRKIFIHDNSKIPLMCKYILYIMYLLLTIIDRYKHHDLIFLHNASPSSIYVILQLGNRPHKNIVARKRQRRYQDFR